MTKKHGHSPVQRTNDSSIVSKCSMASRRYVTDHFTKLFVAKSARRSPLINRGYYVRAKCMSQLFEAFCSAFGKETCQVLSLGAGYDANYFRLKAAGALPVNCRYFEVDLPLVVANKKSVIESCADLCSLAKAVTSGSLSQYRLLGQDIRDVARLESGLRAEGLDFSVPTLVIAECVLSYLDTKHSDRIVEWTSSAFQHVALAVYEQVEPNDAFGIVMTGHFESLGSPLLSLGEYPNVASLRDRYLARSYESCECVSVAEYLWSLDAKEALRFQQLEPFDEFEEWLEKCAHYVFALSRKGRVFEGFLPEGIARSSYACAPTYSTLGPVDWTLHDVYSSLRRFGHSSALTTDGKVLTAGGFAENSGKHSRVFEPVLTDPTTFQSEPISVCIEGRQHFAVLCLDDGRVLVNGGRTSPLRSCDVDVVLIPSPDGSYVAEGSQFAHTPPARWRHTLTKLGSSEGREKAVLFGGRTPCEAALSDTYVLDVGEGSWSEVPQGGLVWPEPRHSHAAVASHDNSSLIVTCGLSSREKPLNCVYSFHLATLTWEEIPVDGLLPRFGHTAHLISSTTVVLVGGVSGRSGEPCGLATIDLVFMLCREVSLPGQDPERPFMTFGHSSVLIEDSDGVSRILIIGGGGNCFSFGTHFNRHIATIDVRRLLECEA
ncbi:tRNA wybutosine-synthesizing protein 4 [Rhipicephalus microplus]|uniref:tRNA wybutosine-synthesizing protein 4 n=1 Tax=Rhipicephalus microplus TaxID=6941 RepID=UPI003F6C8E90